MKSISGIIAVTLTGLLAAVPACAAGFFVGAEAGASSTPDMTGTARQAMINAGYATTTASQDNNSGLAAVFGGQWVTDNLGWEAGLVGLNSFRGRVASDAATPVFTSYQYTAGALSLAALGGIDLTPKAKLFLKAGAYAAGVDYEGPTSTVKTSSAGPMAGLGVSVSIIRHLSVRVEAADYFRVSFPNFEFFTPANSSTRANIVTFAGGAVYEF